MIFVCFQTHGTGTWTGICTCKRRMQIYFQLTLELTEAVAVSSKIVAGAAFRDFDVFVLVL